MASAKKCDRCGAYYDKNERFIKTYQNVKTVVVGMCLVTRSDHSIEDKDLCDNCLHKLNLFLEGVELGEAADEHQ